MLMWRTPCSASRVGVVFSISGASMADTPRARQSSTNPLRSANRSSLLEKIKARTPCRLISMAISFRDETYRMGLPAIVKVLSCFLLLQKPTTL